MTKRLFQFALLAALTAGLSMGVASCSDDDDEKDGRTAEEQAADPYEKETAAGHALYNLLGQLSVVGDDLPDNWKEATFEPSAGEVTDASQPFVRSIAVNSLDEAVTRYNTLTGRNISSATATDTWQQDDLGSMTFTALNQPACFATVDVSIKQLPQLTQLRFVPVTAFGDNGSFNGAPYYRFGDVVKDPKEGTYWICVRPAYSPNKKEDTHWMSFQLGPKNITDPKKGGCQPQKVPTKLGKDLEKMQYLAQLLTIFARPTAGLSADDKAEPYDKEFGQQSFAGNSIGLGGLQQEAMTNEEIIRAAKNWVKHGIWDMVSPSENLSGTDFRKSFTRQVSFLYNGYSTSLFNKNLTLYRVTYADPNKFFKSSPQYNDITLDMTKVSFDIEKDFTKTGKCGDKSYEAVGDCYVVRYKTGKQLSSNLLFNPSPTEALPGVEDVYRFNATPIIDESISAEKAEVGTVIGKDGKFYRNADDARKSDTEPAALVVYMGGYERVEKGKPYHGLAIAVEDLKVGDKVKFAFSTTEKNYVSSMSCDKTVHAYLLDGIAMTEKLASQGDGYPAAVAVSKLKKLENDDANFSPWFVPSIGQWIKAINGLGYKWEDEQFKGQDSGLWGKAGLSDAALVSDNNEGDYWTVNESATGKGQGLFVTHNNSGYWVYRGIMTKELRVRPMIAFGSKGETDPDDVPLPVAPKVGALLCDNGLCFEADTYGHLAINHHTLATPRALVVSVQEEGGKIETGKDWKVLAVSLEEYGGKCKFSYYDYGACTPSDFNTLDGNAMTEKLQRGCDKNHDHNAAHVLMEYQYKHQIEGGTWFLPSVGQWILALQGLGLVYNEEKKSFTPQGKDGYEKVNNFFPDGRYRKNLYHLYSERSTESFSEDVFGYWTTTSSGDNEGWLIDFWDDERGVKFRVSSNKSVNKVRPFVAL